MHQNRFRLGLRPRPAEAPPQTRWGSLQRSPRPPSWIKGPTSKGRGGEGIWEGRGRGGKGGGDREGEGGRGGEGTGREGTPNILLHPQFQFCRNMPGHCVRLF